jgi:hypothetical protein
VARIPPHEVIESDYRIVTFRDAFTRRLEVFATTVTTPRFFAVMRPVELTVATLGFDELHVTVALEGNPGVR